MKNLKMKNKLMLMFILTGLIPIIILGALFYTSIEKEIQKNVFDENMTFYHLKVESIKDYVNEQLQNGRLLSNISDVRNGLSYIENNGKNSIEWLGRYKEIEKIMDMAVNEYDISDVFITDINGDVVFSSKYKEALKGINLSQRKHIQEAMSGKQYISEIFYSDIIGEYILTFSTPIFRDESLNKTIGTLNIIIEQNKIDEIIHSGIEEIGESGDVYIVDENGLLLSNTRLGEYKSNAANKVELSTDVVDMMNKAIKEKDIAFEYNGIHNDYLGNEVLGSAGILKIGDEYASLIIEVDKVEAFRNLKRINLKMLVFLTVSSLLGIVMMIIFAKKITIPLNQLAISAGEIASGKLDIEIDINSDDETGHIAKGMIALVKRLKNYIFCIDEISLVLFDISRGNLLFDLKEDYTGEFEKIKESLNAISSELRSTISQISVAADEVSSGSEQVSGGAQALSQGATEQASSIQELSASITEVSERIKKSADGTFYAKDIASKTSCDVQKGNVYMQNMVNAMEEISTTSNEIENIIKTIDEIAFQTNILALNAAVEAARAGNAGKGFSVVADEVRSLASKSAESAKETSHLIEKAISAVQNGMDIANQTASILGHIVKGVEQSAVIIEDIANNSIEQAESVNQITIGINQISSVVQNNSATAEESAAASEELSAQAQMLNDLVDKFNI